VGLIDIIDIIDIINIIDIIDITQCSYLWQNPSRRSPSSPCLCLRSPPHIGGSRRTPHSYVLLVTSHFLKVEPGER
jgi:hypothetical protein